MNAKKVYIILILFWGFIGLNYFINGAQSSDSDEPDNYGILRGKIVDEDSGKPVNEKFFVSINDLNYTFLSRFGTETDENGFFKTKWKTGTYLLYFAPRSKTSKYCWDPNPKEFPEERQIVNIEKGKITQVIKKAKLAGKLRLKLISTDGDQINPQTLFGEKANCSVRIYGKSLIGDVNGSQFAKDDNFNDGEILVYCLCPDKYKIRVRLNGMGIGSKFLKNVEIKKNSTTEVKINIDFDDPTGVQGVIYYEGGEPIENVDVSVGGPIENPESIAASVFTDKNGYYKIVGLKEGTYDLIFMKEIRDLVFLNISPRKVYVRNGSLSRLDVRLKKRK